MRKIWIGVLLVSSVLCSSCSQKDAREYAKKLADLLGNYSDQIDAKLTDEHQRYKNEAKLNEEALEVDEYQRLSDLRSAKSQQAAADLKAGNLKPAAFVATLLSAYGQADFDSTKALYEKSANAYMVHLKDLADLSVEKAKIDALTQALNTLAKDPGFLAGAVEAAKFGADLKDKVNLNTCTAARSAQAAADKRAEQLTKDVADAAMAANKDVNTSKLGIAKADSAAAAKLAAASCN